MYRPRDTCANCTVVDVCAIAKCGAEFECKPENSRTAVCRLRVPKECPPKTRTKKTKTPKTKTPKTKTKTTTQSKTVTTYSPTTSTSSMAVTPSSYESIAGTSAISSYSLGYTQSSRDASMSVSGTSSISSIQPTVSSSTASNDCGEEVVTVTVYAPQPESSAMTSTQTMTPYSTPMPVLLKRSLPFSFAYGRPNNSTAKPTPKPKPKPVDKCKSSACLHVTVRKETCKGRFTTQRIRIDLNGTVIANGTSKATPLKKIYSVLGL